MFTPFCGGHHSHFPVSEFFLLLLHAAFTKMNSGIDITTANKNAGITLIAKITINPPILAMAIVPTFVFSP